jgi:hypothetical protein
MSVFLAILPILGALIPFVINQITRHQARLAKEIADEVLKGTGYNPKVVEQLNSQMALIQEQKRIVLGNIPKTQPPPAVVFSR